MILVSSWSCLCPIHWSWVLSLECRRCSNYIWVINNLIDYKGASYIRDSTVLGYFFWLGIGYIYKPIRYGKMACQICYLIVRFLNLKCDTTGACQISTAKCKWLIWIITENGCLFVHVTKKLIWLSWEIGQNHHVDFLAVIKSFLGILINFYVSIMVWLVNWETKMLRNLQHSMWQKAASLALRNRKEYF